MEIRSPSPKTSTSMSPVPSIGSVLVVEKDPNQKMRVCMMGDAEVGKSSLVSQFMTSDHIKDFEASLGQFYLQL